MHDARPDEHDQHDAPDDDRRGPGARGGDDADRLPAAPADDDTPLGDTDQHSSVSSDRGD